MGLQNEPLIIMVTVSKQICITEHNYFHQANITVNKLSNF